MTAKTENTQVKITASITKHYGSVSASFGAEIIMPDATPNTLMAGYTVLEGIIGEQFAEYEKRGLPQTNMPLAPGSGSSSEVMDATYFEISMKDGKKGFKFYTEKYAKYGVSVYREVLKDILPVDKMDIGKKYDASMFRVRIEQTGKALKVTGIERIG